MESHGEQKKYNEQTTQRGKNTPLMQKTRQVVNLTPVKTFCNKL